jgi:hypothetical protein
MRQFGALTSGIVGDIVRISRTKPAGKMAPEPGTQPPIVGVAKISASVVASRSPR